jgi:hypothetical protein
MSIPTVPTDFTDEHLDELLDLAQTANTCLRIIETYNREIAKLRVLAADWKPEQIVQTYEVYQQILALVSEELQPDNDKVQGALIAFFPAPYVAKLRKYLCTAYFGVRYAQTLYTQSVASFLVCGLLSLQTLTNKAQCPQMLDMLMTLNSETRDSLFNVTQMIFALVSPPLGLIIKGHLQVVSTAIASLEEQS